MKKGLGLCLKTTFGIAVNFLFVFIILALPTAMFAYDTTKDILVIPFLILEFFVLGLVWKKILWDTVCGETAVLYQSLPVSPGTFLFSKIFTAGFSLGFLLTVLAPAFIVPGLIMGDILYRDAEWINRLNTQILEWEAAGGVSAEGIGMLVLQLFGISFILAALAAAIIALWKKVK